MARECHNLARVGSAGNQRQAVLYFARKRNARPLKTIDIKRFTLIALRCLQLHIL